MLSTDPATWPLCVLEIAAYDRYIGIMVILGYSNRGSIGVILG